MSFATQVARDSDYRDKTNEQVDDTGICARRVEGVDGGKLGKATLAPAAADRDFRRISAQMRPVDQTAQNENSATKFTPNARFGPPDREWSEEGSRFAPGRRRLALSWGPSLRVGDARAKLP